MPTPPPIPPQLPPVAPVPPPIPKPVPAPPMDIEKLKEIERKRKEEEQRKEIERKEEEARKKAARKVWWRKFGIFVFLGAAAAIALPLYFFFTSDSWHFNQGIEALYNKDYDKAIEHLSKVENTKDLKYIKAQYHLYEIYLEKCDSAAACKALKNSLINDNWEDCIPAYSAYAGYLCSGEMAPYINKSNKDGAGLYLKSPDPDIRINAVKPFFDCGRYNDAIKVFDENVNLVYYHDNGIGDAYLCMGTIYRYGLGDAEVDLRKAKDNYVHGFNITDHKLPFVAELADLYVIFAADYKGYYCDIDYISKAKELYFKAYMLAEHDNPFKQFYSDCYDITYNLLNANSITSTEWEDYDIDQYWGSYSFESSNGSTGYYIGQTMRDGWIESPNGWGVFYWENDEVRIGKYDTHCNASGKGLIIRTDGSSTVGKMVGKHGYITEGLENKGETKEIGTFNKRTLKKGKTYDVHYNIK